MRLRVIAGADGRAGVRCPACGVVSDVDLPSMQRSATPVRVRVTCSCGRRLVVFVERRAAGRKAVDLAGSFRPGTTGEQRTMRVRDLSRTGLLFELAAGEEEWAPEEGDLLVVEFTLEHAERHHFVREVVVRRVDSGEVGAEFTAGPDGDSYDRIYDLALALYRPRG